MPKTMEGDPRRKDACKFPECGRVFCTKYTLRIHINRKHTGAEWTCSWGGCREAFDSFEYLERHCDEDHMKTVYSPMPSMDIKWMGARYCGSHCVYPNCGADIEDNKKYVTHLMTFHEPAKYECHHCGDRFFRPDYLQKHIKKCSSQRRKKTVNQRASCSGSVASSSSSSARPSTSAESVASTSGSIPSARILSVENEEEEDSNLDHEQVEDQEKESQHPFKCKSAGCHHAFKSRSGLRSHRLTVHEEVRLCCPHKDCDRSYTQPPALKAHVAKFHHDS